MRHAAITNVALFGVVLAGMVLGACSGVDGGSSSGGPPGNAPRAVPTAGTKEIPECTSFVDAASSGGQGTATAPYETIAEAVAAADNGAIICVAEGTYAEELAPGEKYFTLAGGFQKGKEFKVRDSSRYVSKAQGSGGSFLRIEDPAPKEDQLTAIDGFEITGYSQAIYRDVYYSQRFDITNNFIHDNECADTSLVGAGFSLNNVSGTIKDNVFSKNTCGRGGAGALNDALNESKVLIENNLFEGNAGNEPGSSHGGALYLFGNELRITANEFIDNTVTGWGAGLYVGAYTPGGQQTSATLTWNVYRDNRAGIAGGGLFCDDSATCLSDHEIYDKNCGGNIYLDSGPGGAGPTIAKFDHLTNFGALEVGCNAPGNGVQIDRENDDASDDYSFTNAIFSGNAEGRDFVTGCNSGCDAVKVNVTYSMVQTDYTNGGLDVTFGTGNVAPEDPLFVDAKAGDFHLKSTEGHWTPDGYVKDNATSPAIGKGDPDGAVDDNPDCAGDRSELGAYGNSGEASCVR